MPSRSYQPLQATVEALFRCRRLLWGAAHRTLAAQDEAMWDWQILAHARHGAVSQNRLATTTAQHPTAVSRLLSHLEGQGLVRRVRAAGDRRRVEVELTEAGQAKYQALAKPVWGTMAELLAVLDPDEMAALQRLLGKVLAHGQHLPGESLPGCSPRHPGT